MNMEDRLNKDILACKNISVVLEKRESESPYIESYRLNSLIYKEGEFWGKFSNSHCPHGHPEVGNWELLSYAYNNFSPVVCTLSLNSRMERYSSANAYSNISFTATGHYKKIWSMDENSGSGVLHEAVVSGLRMKARIATADGFVYVLPVHTIVMYKDTGDFFLQTEFDGIPKKITDFEAVNNISCQLYEYMEKNPGTPYVATEPKFNSDYFLTYFCIKNNMLTQRVFDNGGNLLNEEVDYIEVDIWIEAN